MSKTAKPVGVLLLALGAALVAFAVTVQLRTRGQDETYSTARRADLVQLLDGLNQDNRRLEGELGELDRTRRELQSGADSERVAREQAEQRNDELAVLAGTVRAEGPGIRITIRDPQHKVTADLLLNAVEELRDAGAEAMEIDDSVRIVGSSWFGTGSDGLTVDGQPVVMPMTIDVIGDPHALEEGARFRGGLVSEITGAKVQGQVDIERRDSVQIDAVHTPAERQYARPTGSASPR